MECQLDKKPFFQCCCKCVWHYRIYNRNFELTDNWVCLFVDDFSEDGKPNGKYHIFESEEHSCGCECYMTDEKTE